MFKLTAQTDPKTIMFEGFPQVQIKDVRDTKYGPGQFAVYIGDPAGAKFNNTTMREGNNHFYDVEGRDQSGGCDNVWPRIIERFKFDPTKPIVGVDRENGKRVPFKLVETITPADGAEPRYGIMRADGGGVIFYIYASTGRSTGMTGSDYDFISEVKRTYGTTADNGRISLNVTEINGEITAVEWIK